MRATAGNAPDFQSWIGSASTEANAPLIVTGPDHWPPSLRPDKLDPCAGRSCSPSPPPRSAASRRPNAGCRSRPARRLFRPARPPRWTCRCRSRRRRERCERSSSPSTGATWRRWRPPSSSCRDATSARPRPTGPAPRRGSSIFPTSPGRTSSRSACALLHAGNAAAGSRPVFPWVMANSGPSVGGEPRHALHDRRELQG
jgi:hypothetical protein